MPRAATSLEDRQRTMKERRGPVDDASRGHDLLTIAELAAVLRCSKAHAAKILNERVPGLPRLPHLALGRRKLVRRAALDEWMRKVEVGGSQATVLSSSRQDSMSQAHGKEGNHHA